MPELPEVETVVRDLRPLLVGRELRAVRRSKHSLRVKWQKGWEKAIAGKKVVSIQRRGKWIRVDLDNGSLLIVHLGMTGQLTIIASDEAVPDHTHLVFELDRPQELRYRDVRRFGSLTFYPQASEWEAILVGKLGPEPWDMPLDQWREALKGTQRNLKAALLDQSLIAGVGNIYADESCFLARLDPRRKGSSLKVAEKDRLLDSIQKVLTKAIECRGSTIRDYVGGSGLQGGYQGEFQAYGRTGEPCTTCGSPIQCVRLAGRSTHFCSRCQK
jgi:formamidopyrimidine-DNA glycosylase